MRFKLNILFLLLLAAYYNKVLAQDTAIYPGPAEIRLYSGKWLTPVRLWKIDSVRTAFVRNGNLTEVFTADIQSIVTLDFELSFENPFRLNYHYYDLIFPAAGDTLRGYIQRFENGYVYYIPAKGKYLKKTMYIGYVIKNPSVIPPHENSTADDKDSVVVVKTPQSADTQTSFIKRYFDRSDINARLNNDLVMMKDGRWIWCTIHRESATNLYAHTRRAGKDPEFVLPLSDIDRYINNADGPFVLYIPGTQQSQLHSKRYRRNEDQIVTRQNETIGCRILSANEMEICFHVAVAGKDTRYRIPSSEVLRYEKSLKENPESQEYQKKMSKSVALTLFLISGLFLTFAITMF